MTITTAEGIASLWDMTDDIVIVTGASSGIGAAAAHAFAAVGATVVVLGRSPERTEAVADEIRDAGGAAHAYPVDQSDRVAVAEALERIAREVGAPTVVVANAGIAGGPSYRDGNELADYSDAEWDDVVGTNLTGTFATLRAASRILGDGGRIVVTSSTAGMRTDPMVSYGYVATKAAILNLVRQLALELAPRGIRVNAIAPGPFKGTRIGDGKVEVTPEAEAMWASTVPLARMGTMPEIQGPMLFLASEASSFVTGTALAVDGGALALSHTGF